MRVANGWTVPPPPWGPPTVTCDTLTDTLPDTLYAEVTSAATPTDGIGIFEVGNVVAMPLGGRHPNAWGGTWGLEPFYDDGVPVTLGFTCQTQVFPPYPSWLVTAYLGAIPDVFFDMMNGTHELGGADRWEHGVPALEPPLFPVTETGLCHRCGISVWKTITSIDFLGLLTNNRYTQEVTFRISGVNPKTPDPYHTFAPWFWPEGYFPPDFF